MIGELAMRVVASHETKWGDLRVSGPAAAAPAQAALGRPRISAGRLVAVAGPRQGEHAAAVKHS